MQIDLLNIQDVSVGQNSETKFWPGWEEGISFRDCLNIETDILSGNWGGILKADLGPRNSGCNLVWGSSIPLMF